MPDQFDTLGLTWRISPDLLAIFDGEGRFAAVNPSWSRVLGWSEEALVGRSAFELIHPDDLLRTTEAFEASLAGEPVISFENRYRHEDGSYRWLSWFSVAQDDSYFASARDVTGIRDTATDLEERTLEGRLREEFIAVLGHDLRNPLSAVTSALRIIRRNPTGPRTPEVLGMAEHAVERMNALIGDILDFARARLGGDIGIMLRPDVDLEPVIAQTVSEVQVSHPAVTILEDYNHGEPFTCDPDRIAQVVSNLLGNAIGHGDTSRPIRVSTLDDGPTIRITVTNAGAPISDTVLEELFEPFTRGADSPTRQGLGLGLYICRSIALAHGGSLTARSGNDLTSFTLRLPRVPGPAGRPPADGHAPAPEPALSAPGSG